MASEEQKKFLLRFGKNLLELRKKKNLSYRKLAQKCDIDHADIRKYEKGEINMTILTMVEFSKGLEISLKELMEF
ncbi:helix-turn-helix domain-containing protein [Mucilaginibacter gilvus]|uniref:XRE family transcriptional regulator n=1 Tax=Mucilaginibacter gilvus TaxID=2305909 RepID=A0A444MI94_9SPHI|nr:helix-turn-helix transcriptional regulator [Mucilaginibacter gilvus]RWY47471.1 XRE family transcriptional regulator [Mucilaginibacter gilvus]